MEKEIRELTITSSWESRIYTLDDGTKITADDIKEVEYNKEFYVPEIVTRTDHYSDNGIHQVENRYMKITIPTNKGNFEELLDVGCYRVVLKTEKDKEAAILRESIRILKIERNDCNEKARKAAAAARRLEFQISQLEKRLESLK
jgi:hypothetical protein